MCLTENSWISGGIILSGRVSSYVFAELLEEVINRSQISTLQVDARADAVSTQIYIALPANSE